MYAGSPGSSGKANNREAPRMTVEQDTEVDETEAVYRHRYREARDAGMSIVEAQLFADSDGDLAVLRKLLAAGCTPQMILRILL